jgi:transmembrane sensor
MSESEKLKYIHAYLTKQMSRHDMSVFQEWLDTHPNHHKLYLEVSKIWEASSTNETIHFDYSNAYNKHLTHLRAQDNKLEVVGKKRNWFSIASSIAAVLVLAIAMVLLFGNDKHTFRTGDFTQMHILPDGSKAWLSKNSQLSYHDFSGSLRKVNVSGVVFLDVAANKNAPFQIMTDRFEVKVVGTQFLVNTERNFVAVKEGTVDVKTGKSAQRITKDQKITIYKSGDLAHSDTVFDSNAWLWFNEDLIFKNTPFDQVIQDLSNNFNVKILIPERTTWSSCTFTSGSLKTNTLDQILEILKLTYDLQYVKQKDNSIKLTSVKCK